jgi:hypothetical protein
MCDLGTVEHRNRGLGLAGDTGFVTPYSVWFKNNQAFNDTGNS